MKALTVLQPWASMLAYHGKDVENRSWAPRPSMLRPGEVFAIHAGKGFDREGWEWIMGNERILRLPPGGYGINDYGAVLAVAEFNGTTSDVDGLDSLWAFGPVCWVLTNKRALAEPVHCRGAQGLWNLPADVEARVLAQIAASKGGRNG